LTYLFSFSLQAFSNPEDAKLHPKAKITTADPDVERVRRAHLNDLENIPFFILIGWLYLFTNPDLFIAKNAFRVFTAARYIHTLVYAVVPLPQPSRGLAFAAGLAVNVYMTFAVLMAAL
jgi:glutathione S-transferase